MRTAAVTGAASGIGAALRGQLEADGWEVIGVDLDGVEVSADLSEPSGRAAAVAGVLDRCDGALDALVACAGVGPHVEPTSRIAAVNHFGTVAALDGLEACLSAGDAPAAVVVASNSMGLVPPDPELTEALSEGREDRALARAGQLDGSTVYANSKLAVARAVRRRAEEWGAAGIRLNAVAPGPVETPLLQGSLEHPDLGPLVDALPVPLARRSHPAEIAAVIRFLLSEQAAYIHGSVLFVDGGTDALLRPDAV